MTKSQEQLQILENILPFLHIEGDSTATTCELVTESEQLRRRANLIEQKTKAVREYRELVRELKQHNL